MPTEQQDAMPDLKLPDWLPHVVRLAAETIYEREVRASSPDDINLLNCLSSDERMKSVWSELRKSKYKSTKTFVCPSDFYFISLAKSKRMKATELCQKGGDFNKATARLLEGQADVLDRQREQGQALWPEQECATYWFFHCAYYVAQDPRPLLSRAELKQERAAYSTAQQKLNELSETLRSLGMKSKAEELQRISVEVEDCASWVEVDAEDRGQIIDRHRSDVFLRSYVVRLARINRVIFGRVLYGTLATTTNVAFDLQRPIEGKQIREILRSLPDSGIGLEDFSIP
jgi:hypothetical protein